MLYVVYVIYIFSASSGPLSLDFDRNTYEAPGYTRPSEMVSVNSGGSNLWSHRRLSYPSNTSLINPRHSVVYSDPDKIRSSANSVISPCYRRQSRDVHGNPLFSTCSKCGGKYTNPGMCASHEASCNGSNRLMCHICKRVYSQMCALKEHLRGKHGLAFKLQCHVSSAANVSVDEVYDLLGHYGQATCLWCSHKCNHQELFRKHVRIHHEGVQPIICTNCWHVCADYDSFVTHCSHKESKGKNSKQKEKTRKTAKKSKSAPVGIPFE
ncbi:transcription factor btd isoform X1, partial [Biomphalaria pfeifferi]